MAARRLIAVLVVLLVISSFAAALAPREPAEQSTAESTTTPASTAPSTDAAVIEERIAAEPQAPVSIEAETGDRLQLEVAAAEPSEVEIAGLGLIAVAAPGAPARFDLILRSPGRFVVTLPGDEEPKVGELHVSRP